MKAMILAAGRGERLRPMTDNQPKPLLKAGGKALIVYHIENLVRAGIRDIVINLSYLGDAIRDCIGNGEQFGANISYSDEGTTPLETGGGIFRALPLLGDDPFVVINGDIWIDFSLLELPEKPKYLAHLVLVNNPVHHPHGDFSLKNGAVTPDSIENALTFSGIGIYSPQLFSGCTEERFPLAPLLRTAMVSGQVTGQHYQGIWMDIGTKERLEELDSLLRSSKQN